MNTNQEKPSKKYASKEWLERQVSEITSELQNNNNDTIERRRLEMACRYYIDKLVTIDELNLTHIEIEYYAWKK